MDANTVTFYISNDTTVTMTVIASYPRDAMNEILEKGEKLDLEYYPTHEVTGFSVQFYFLNSELTKPATKQ